MIVKCKKIWIVECIKTGDYEVVYKIVNKKSKTLNINVKKHI